MFCQLFSILKFRLKIWWIIIYSINNNNKNSDSERNRILKIYCIFWLYDRYVRYQVFYLALGMGFGTKNAIKTNIQYASFISLLFGRSFLVIKLNWANIVLIIYYIVSEAASIICFFSMVQIIIIKNVDAFIITVNLMVLHVAAKSKESSNKLHIIFFFFSIPE